MLRRSWWLCLWTALATAGAYGQGAEASLSVGAAIYTDKNLGDLGIVGATQETLRLQNGFRISARFGVNSWRFFGHEFGYGYNRTKLVFGSQGDVGMGVHHGFYDFVAHALPEGSSLRPFVCGGAGFSTFFPPGTSAFAGNGITKVNYNYGGGFKVRLSTIYGMRFDLRDYVTGKPFDLPNVRGRLHNIEASAGIALFF